MEKETIRISKRWDYKYIEDTKISNKPAKKVGLVHYDMIIIPDPKNENRIFILYPKEEYEDRFF